MKASRDHATAIRAALEGAFGERIVVDPREYLERVLAGMFGRQPDMSGDQRRRLNGRELHAVIDVADCLMKALSSSAAQVDGASSRDDQ